MPSSEEPRSPRDNNRTLRLDSSVDGSPAFDMTTDARLYATLSEGTAEIDQLRLLIPGFEILEELGRGAFGVVYRARDVKLDRFVAIKVALLDDPARREQYIREARNAAKLETPGIVPVFQVGTLRDGQPFVVQRLIEGSSLRKILAEQGALDLVATCRMMVDIAQAMGQAHSLGMIHRDLKPDNILVDASGRPWIADFGLAILEEDQNLHRGERAGTPLYMSPEQLRGRTEWLDGRTDIYALGIMLYEMLTGRPPFDAQNLAELEEQVLHRDPKPITQRVAHLPAAVDVIFQNCCAKRVGDRYANAQDLVADLQALLAEVIQQAPLPAAVGGLAAAELVGRPSAPMPIPLRRKTLRQSAALQATQVQSSVGGASRRRLWIAASLAGLVVVGLAAVVWWPPSELPATVGDMPAAVGDTPLVQGATIDPSTAAAAILPPAAPAELPGTVAPSELPATDNAAATAAATETQASPRPPQLIVSKGSQGTHATLAAALAVASEGETITILPGNYLESLTLQRSVHLVGQGDREDIVIVAENQTAFDMHGDIEVTLTNLTLDGLKSGQQDVNTLAVHGGKLTLESCDVHSRSLDCVKLHADSSLIASQCRFRSTAHPAISAERTRSLVLMDCRFDIRPPTLEAVSIPVGVQATECGGTLRNCSLIGAGAAVGVHWQGARQPVTIEDCSFENCQYGLVIQDCQQVTIASIQAAGAVDQPPVDAATDNGTTPSQRGKGQIVGCQVGLLLERSSVALSQLQVLGSEGKQGVRVLGGGTSDDAPQLTIDDCRISGFGEGLSIEQARVRADRLHCSHNKRVGINVAAQSKLQLRGSLVTDNELTGLLIEDATVQLQDCQLVNNAYAGVLVDSYADCLVAEDCEFRGNTSGLLMASGTAEVRQGRFADNGVGILVGSRELLGQESAGEPTPVFLSLSGVVFESNEKGGMIVRAACSYRVAAGEGGDDLATLAPKILGDLKAAEVDGLTVVRPSAGGGKAL